MRIIFHIDVNSAYLSWTAVEQLKNGARTDIRTIPAIIGGDQKSRHGIVLAKSVPAKKYGIRTGEPVANAFRKCPNLHMEAPDHEMYHKHSRELMAFLRSYTPDIEQVSVDECYMDFTGISGRFASPVEAAFEIKDEVKKRFGFTVNIGISDVKVLAKMASDFEKPDRVHTLFRKEIQKKMWPLPVRELLFLGKASEKKLIEAGIRTIGDLAHAREADIQTLIGKKNGHQLYQYARGIDDSPVKAQPDEAKGFSAETTFNEDIISIEQVNPILLVQCDIVAARMRRKKKKCTSVSITFRTLDFRNRSHQTKLPNATDITDEIYRCAKQLFRESWKGEPLRLIGVAVTGLTEDDFEQLSLFEDPEKKEKSRKLDAALDAIRQKYGNDKVTRASILNCTQGIARKAKAQMKNDDNIRKNIKH